jgi:biotin carboxyl carrier protein
VAVPGSSEWQSQILRGVGAPITPANLQVVDAWQRAEGGTALNNPFNTTQLAPGASSYNSVGVRNYPTPQAGIDATIQTLRNGRYQNVLDALRQGTSAMGTAQAIAASPWGTGAGVERVLGGPSGAPAPTLPAPSVSPAPLSSPSATPLTALGAPNLGMGVVAGLQSGNLLGGIMGSLLYNQPAAPKSTLPAGGAPSSSVPLGGAPAGGPAPKVGAVKLGDPIPPKYQTSIGGLHPTEGLAGFPAHDYFAPAGAPVAAPVTGTIVKLSGNNPADGPTEGPHGPFGWSAYVQGQNGRTYYLTHMGTRDVKVGETVKAGQVIGTVGDYAKYGTPSHIHMGVSAPGVQVS